ncbi:TIR domain-containing protein [Brachybacterium massiliense]|uniref:TIR domain-containing protein n=1 Tax=Brachybacterium massiliense TaxID=1755098 RepID=UPI000B3BB73D|nr:nucleotide-binding protein [Brachybacterium massiliense]
MAILQPPPPPLPKLFIGSSSEGKDVAEDLEHSLGSTVHPVRWDLDVFDPGSFTLEALLQKAAEVDFAILVATPDDTTTKRGTAKPAARDNIILEFGIFVGALGRDRTFILAAGEIDLPSDLFGLTRLPYRDDVGGGLPAVRAAAYQVKQAFGKLGRRASAPQPGHTSLPSVGSAKEDSRLLEREIAKLKADALTQGWVVKTDSESTLRLRSPRGRTIAMPKSTPRQTREELRDFVRKLRGHGLRTSSAFQRPLDTAPW